MGYVCGHVPGPVWHPPPPNMRPGAVGSEPKAGGNTDESQIEIDNTTELMRPGLMALRETRE